MATPKQIQLYFVQPIYARGEDIGKNAYDENGKVNMIRISRGTKLTVRPEIAKDLIISRQAIDYENSSASDRREAEEYVAERNRIEENEAEKKTSETKKKIA